VRILHTSDWHLGLQTGRFSRLAEHQLFLTWLQENLSQKEVDVLIVAGDIFDGMNPSNESLNAYFAFLSCLESTGVRDVVIVGGNHDSPSQIDAPRALLQRLNVHVVGGYSRESDKESYLVPLRVRGRDEPQAVCVALPYVHEWRLGIRTTGDLELTRKEFTDRFSALYSELADLAEEKYPGLPLVGTGHLTMGKPQKGDSPQEIHQVGFIDALSPEILDKRLCYVALGHIHRSFPVERGRIWYSGSPIPISLPEMSHPRRVLLVDLPEIQSSVAPSTNETKSSAEGKLTRISGDQIPPLLVGGGKTRHVPKARGTGEQVEIQVQPLNIPVARSLLELSGDEEEVLSELNSLTWQSKLAPYLYLKIFVTEAQPQLLARVREALDRFHEDKRPLLVELRELSQVHHAALEDKPVVPLEELTVHDVFSRLCEQREEPARPALLSAFNFLASVDPEVLQEKLDDMEGGASGSSPATSTLSKIQP